MSSDRPELVRIPPAAWLTVSSTALGLVVAFSSVSMVPVALPAMIEDLSLREAEVLRYLAEMLSTAEIAAAMFISVNTVRTHIRSILRKFGVSRRNQAVRRARERGLL